MEIRNSDTLGPRPYPRLTDSALRFETLQHLFEWQRNECETGRLRYKLETYKELPLCA